MVLVSSVALGLGLSAAEGEAPRAAERRLGEETWPFITIRDASSAALAPERFREFVAINARHPGSADEYWMGGFRISFTPEQHRAFAAKIVPFRKEMERAGIAFGAQKVTLGHGAGHFKFGPDGTRPGFFAELPDSAFMCGMDGRRMANFCPRSKAAQDLEERNVECMAREANPVSIWLDDDMRMAGRRRGCFCPDCIAAFNRRFGYALAREEIVRRLTDESRLQDPLRRDWRIFAGESLGEYAAAARRGADKVNPRLRLGVQTIHGTFIDAASDYSACLKALAGANGLKSGIRAGAGEYFESISGFHYKSMACLREAERCHGYPFVAQVSYEQENYPREVLHKSAEAILIESTMALAAGCDALTEYWWDAHRDEPLGYYEEFAEMLAAWRPYLEKVASFSSRTTMGGLARFRGANFDQLVKPDVLDPCDRAFAFLGVPVTLFESKAATWYVNAGSLDEFGPGDAEKLAASGAVVDASVWDRFLKAGGASVATAAEKGRFVKFDLNSMRKGAIKFSSGPSMPTHAERQSFLDAIDAVCRVPVRIDRAHPLCLYPRVNAAGRLAAVTIVNASIGKCLPTAVRLRRPAARKVAWWRPCERPLPLEVKSGDGDEITVTVPSLPGMQPGTLVLE